jgi:hypothetical protein
MAKKEAAKPEAAAPAAFVRPDDLTKISTSVAEAKATEQAERSKKQAQIDKDLQEAFMGRDVLPGARDRLNVAMRHAAEHGQNEIQVLTFPAKYCNDKGRRINNNEPDWPESLEGFAKKAFDYFERDLKPLGFHLRVQVLDYPGGMPGNVGMYLKW